MIVCSLVVTFMSSSLCSLSASKMCCAKDSEAGSSTGVSQITLNESLAAYDPPGLSGGQEGGGGDGGGGVGGGGDGGGGVGGGGDGGGGDGGGGDGGGDGGGAGGKGGS